MDATKFVLETRQELLDYANDYSAYASRLSRRLASTKKRLGIQEKYPAKHHPTFEVSAAQLAQNHEWVANDSLLSPVVGKRAPCADPTSFPSFLDSSRCLSLQLNDTGPSPWPGGHATRSTAKQSAKS